jgi:23S rRNA G2445 N2-methylase RlmL
MLQKWQAYHRYRQTYDATWKDAVEKAWTDFRSEWEAENLDVPIPRTKRFEVMNDFIKKTFNTETAEKKEEVEDYRKKLKEEKVEILIDDQNAEFQTYVMNPPHGQSRYLIHFNSGIDKLPRTLMTVGDSIVKQTGWNVTILVGGPMPREGGKLQTYMFVPLHCFCKNELN